MDRNKVTVRDIARSANVSASAVSLVLNKKPGVSAETRERIWQAISELGYEIRQETDNDTPRAVGLLIEKSSMPAVMDVFYGEVIGGFQAEAQRSGYHVVLHMYDRNSESLDRLRKSFTDQVRGLVVANDGDITPEMVIQLGAINLPLVLVENSIAGLQVPAIVGDNFVAGYTVMHHLLELGHRKIALLTGSSKYSSLVERARGCLAGAAEAGLLIPREWMPQPTPGHPKKGYLQMRTVLQQPDRPTAIVAISDKTAFGAMEAIKEAGLQIPEDIAIASIDDVTEAAYTEPPLTSYRIPRHEMGVLAMQTLHRLVSGHVEVPVKINVYGQLVVRQSSGGLLPATQD
jgi:DNA-binding LacI/PurR family transcriptional regulator